MYSTFTGTSYSWPKALPTDVPVFATGGFTRLTNPTEQDLIDAGWIDYISRFPADTPPTITNAQYYAAPALVDGRVVVSVIDKTAEELLAELAGLRGATFVTKRQFKLQLLAIDKYDTVYDTYAALPAGAEKNRLLIEWNDGDIIFREGPLMLDIESRLGYTDIQIDNFFTAAKLL